MQLNVCSELVKEYRGLTKYIRDLERDIRSDMIKASEFETPSSGRLSVPVMIFKLNCFL